MFWRKGIPVFFSSFEALIRVMIIGILGYVALILLLRVSGKRTLSKMNAFDFVVTVALGSTLATVLLSKDVALLEGITAFAVLIGLQFIIAWSSVRSALVRRLIKSEPALLFYKGNFIEHALIYERVTHDEVRAAVRSQGAAGMAAVDAVVLETDGSFSVIQASVPSVTALEGVRNTPQSLRKQK